MLTLQLHPLCSSCLLGVSLLYTTHIFRPPTILGPLDSCIVYIYYPSFLPSLFVSPRPSGERTDACKWIPLCTYQLPMTLHHLLDPFFHTRKHIIKHKKLSYIHTEVQDTYIKKPAKRSRKRDGELHSALSLLWRTMSTRVGGNVHDNRHKRKAAKEVVAHVLWWGHMQFFTLVSVVVLSDIHVSKEWITLTFIGSEGDDNYSS